MFAFDLQCGFGHWLNNCVAQSVIVQYTPEGRGGRGGTPNMEIVWNMTFMLGLANLIGLVSSLDANLWAQYCKTYFSGCFASKTAPIAITEHHILKSSCRAMLWGFDYVYFINNKCIWTFLACYLQVFGQKWTVAPSLFLPISFTPVESRSPT